MEVASIKKILTHWYNYAFIVLEVQWFVPTMSTPTVCILKGSFKVLTFFCCIIAKKINPNFKICTTFAFLIGHHKYGLIVIHWYRKKILFLNIFSGFRDFWTHVSSRLPNCEDRRSNGTVQWAFTLVNPNISSYWSSILCPGIFQKNYARLILVIYLVMLIYLLLKKSLLIFFWMVSIKLVIHFILRKIKQGKREDISPQRYLGYKLYSKGLGVWNPTWYKTFTKVKTS